MRRAVPELCWWLGGRRMCSSLNAGQHTCHCRRRVTAATVPPLAIPCPQSFGVTGGEVSFTAGAAGRCSARPWGARRRRGAMGLHAAAAHTAAFVQAPGAAALPAPALRPRQLTARSRAKSGAARVFILLGLHLPAALPQHSVCPSLGCLTHTALLWVLQSLSSCCPAHPRSLGRAQRRIHLWELLLALPCVLVQRSLTVPVAGVPSRVAPCPRLIDGCSFRNYFYFSVFFFSL